MWGVCATALIRSENKSPTDLQSISRQLARTLSPCGCHNVPHLYAQRKQYLVSKYVCYGLHWTKHIPLLQELQNTIFAALLTLRNTQGRFINFFNVSVERTKIWNCPFFSSQYLGRVSSWPPLYPIPSSNGCCGLRFPLLLCLRRRTHPIPIWGYQMVT